LKPGEGKQKLRQEQKLKQKHLGSESKNNFASLSFQHIVCPSVSNCSKRVGKLEGRVWLLMKKFSLYVLVEVAGCWMLDVGCGWGGIPGVASVGAG